MIKDIGEIIEYNKKSEDVPLIKTSEFERKLKILKESSKDKNHLVFLADYDDTFSKKYFNQNRVFVSYRVITSSKKVSEDFVNTTRELVKKYEPYERDTSLDFKERDKMMYEYYDLTMVALVKEKIHKSDFDLYVKETLEKESFCFRNGVKEYFNLLKKYNLTIIFISAGLQEVIEAELKLLLGEEEFNYLIDNKLLIILANKLFYDQNNVANGYNKPFIYTFNKNYFVNEEIKKYNFEDNNYNVIFFGDHLNDIDAISDLKCKTTFGVAFGNFSKDKLDKDFYKKYDVVIEGDGDFWFINNFIEDLFKN